ncbi:glycoside hydrolase family 16 protein [Eudoraea chungangensis]|uniref:glycoside hydrolase family 16 protein n=1 Tax=Eudoraea chungangensis TaxID=1481905 RepID=UPI0023EB3B89|nr:glycoside hydrolase family 16 protein [Eudoraea chungangensis]
MKIRNKTVSCFKEWSTFIFFGILTSCSSSNSQEVFEEIQEEVEEEVLLDVYAEDYWDNAELVWADEFDGTEILNENWTFETGSHGWGNNELQDYVVNDNIEVSNGTLKIIAKKKEGFADGARYTSTRLNSVKQFRYGRMEFKAKMPEDKGNGIWPALWMLGYDIHTVGWPACGEIDIMEYVSFEPNQTHFSIHSTANNHKNGTQITSGPVPLESIEEEFHIYGLLWTDKYIKFYIDDINNIQLNFQRPANSNYDNWPFSKPFYFLMNIAVGGDWGGIYGVDDTIFPATMEVDYVRVYQVK